MRTPTLFGLALWASCLALAPQNTPDQPVIEPQFGQAAQSVTLLHPGDAPRIPMRYALNKGSVQEITMSSTTRIAQSVDGMPLPETAIPQINARFALEIVSATDNSFAYEMRTVDIEALPTDAMPEFQLQMVNAELKPLKNLRFVITIDASGLHQKTDAHLPDDLPPGAAKMLEGVVRSFDQFVVPFPAEPIGVGARWQVGGVIDVGVLVDQVRTLELESFDADSGALTIRMTLEQTLDEARAMDIEELPDGFTATMQLFTGTGETRFVQMLHEPTPRRLRGDSENFNTLLISGDDVEQAIDTTVMMSFEIETVEPDNDRD